MWSITDGLDSRPLDGETALVTGSLGGLGRVMTEILAAAGAKVVVHHLGQHDAAREFEDSLKDRGADAVTVEADITDWQQTEDMYSRISACFGDVSLLVNNAGIMRKQRFSEMTRSQWDETIDVDLGGVFNATRLAIPNMLKAGRGRVVNIVSQLAYKGAHDYVSYSAAKAGVVGFTRALSREVGPVVGVNAIAPGPIETPMTAGIATEDWVRERTSGAVVQRLGTAEEIAPAVVFLASPGADFMHGQVLHLNGGGVMI